jgi:hypothetical protein
MRTLFKAAVPAVAAAGLLFGTGTAAHADTSSCWGDSISWICRVAQVTAAGQADATTEYIYSNHSSGLSWQNSSGYSMTGWAQRRYGTGSWYTVAGPYSIPNGGGQEAGPIYDAGSYQVRACFQFPWSGAAVHCTTPY